MPPFQGSTFAPQSSHANHRRLLPPTAAHLLRTGSSTTPSCQRSALEAKGPHLWPLAAEMAVMRKTMGETSTCTTTTVLVPPTSTVHHGLRPRGMDHTPGSSEDFNSSFLHILVSLSLPIQSYLPLGLYLIIAMDMLYAGYLITHIYYDISD
jgi:hypothetical protein